MTVGRITIHHEGAGTPTDNPRGADGGYSIWIGTSGFTMLRAPEVSWATIHWNHRSLDICLSGNREQVPVSENDVRLVRDACAEARRRGWVTDNPTVVPHREVFATACPGAYTMGRWAELVAACQSGSVPSTPGGGEFPPFDPNNGRWSLWPLAQNKPIVRVGSRGDAVRYLQGVMRLRANQQVAIDGVFGDRQTRPAVINIQRVFGLATDGIVGPRTWAAIDQLALKG